MALLLIPFVAVAMALPPDYRLLHEGEDCVVSIGPGRTDAPRRVRAECTWAEIDLVKARAVLSDFVSYSTFIPNIRTATIVRDEGHRKLVFQEHDIPLFSDREVQLWMSVLDHDTGGFTVSWVKSDEPFEPSRGHAAVKFNEGRWEVGPASDGGIHVIHEIAYDPGVMVPDWMVRRYRTNGVMTVMRNVRSLAGGAGAGP